MNKINDLFTDIKAHKWDSIIQILRDDKDNFIDLTLKDPQNNYLLSYAVLFNKLDIVKLLVEKGARIDVIDADERSILYMTIKYNYIEVLEYLLTVNKQYIGISITDIRDKNYHIPLHYAIIYKNHKAVKLLLEFGSNPNIVDKFGNNALHLIIYSRSEELCELILTYNININLRTNIGETALHIACNLQEIKMIRLILHQKDVNVNIQDYEHEFTPLHYSINLNNMAQIKLLLEFGADPLIQDIYGNTPIHYCIIENNYQAFLLLIKPNNPNKQVNLNVWNIEGKLPLHLLFEINPDNINDYLKILIDPSNLNIQDSDGNTCLHFLVKIGIWKEYNAALVQKKLDITIVNKVNKRPCDYLKKSDEEEFIELLTDSYLFRLRANKDNTTKWMEAWENVCKKELLSDTISKEEKEIIKTADVRFKKGEDICRTIVKKRLISIIADTNTNKCSQKSFPVKHTYICLKLNDQQNVGVCTFTGSTIDILIGLIYLLKKHTTACGTVNRYFYKNNDLCKLYENIGISMNTRCEFLNFEIVWVHSKLYLHDNFYDNFRKCLSNQHKRFIVIPIGIEMREGSHANYLIYDKEIKELERFEPHGSTTPPGFNYNPVMLDNILEDKISEIDKDIKYIRPHQFLPKIGFQLLDIYENRKKRIGDPGGFCALWGIWYVDMRITYKDINRNVLVDILIKQIKSQNISFKNMIRSYGQNVIQIRDTILNKANIDINDWLNDQLTDKQVETVIEEITSELYKTIRN